MSQPEEEHGENPKTLGFCPNFALAGGGWRGVRPHLGRGREERKKNRRKTGGKNEIKIKPEKKKLKPHPIKIEKLRKTTQKHNPQLARGPEFAKKREKRRFVLFLARHSEALERGGFGHVLGEKAQKQ